MGNIFDYLDWRGDIPFSMDPFNEVDNLVLSELAYVDFSGIVPEKILQPVSIEEVCERFWQLHTQEEVEKSGTLFWQAPMILKKLCSGARFGNMRLGGYVNLISREKNEQMAAVTCFLEDGTAYVAFRGTDDTVIGWKEDFSFSFQNSTEGQRSAAAYLTQCFGAGAGKMAGMDEALENSSAAGRQENSGDSFPLRVGGHSKGGNFSVFAAAFCEQSVRDRILEVFTNDGPGFLKEVTESWQYKAVLPKIKSIIPEESVFGLLLENASVHMVVHSTQKGIWQHDMLSWVVLRNRLRRAPRVSESSLLFEKSVEAWINGMTMEERKEFVDIVFSLFEGTGVENISELSEDQFRSVPELLRSYWGMSGEDKARLRQSIGGLIRSGINSIGDEIRPRLIRRT